MRAYLALRDRGDALLVFENFRHHGAHFVSATGSEKVPDDTGLAWFPDGVHPRRVLEPLISLLAMTNSLDGETAVEGVGT
ncbi:hypothetical protein I6A84_34655 [Frankia sp. CNm7]|uniref:hypothetical protein n=1 Tax=Frankia nepalensis TaxID=1836974 RepID=UPI0019319973|nr:hypothetical protein [Frankia nepalensis]MBL7498028.1 hypothetical protein [Frankia nepalensis]MBL7523089.1 hypothetical protein [Frankia nepalensis]